MYVLFPAILSDQLVLQFYELIKKTLNKREVYVMIGAKKMSSKTKTRKQEKGQELFNNQVAKEVSRVEQLTLAAKNGFLSA